MILERYVEPEKDDEAIVTLPTTFDEKAWQELLEMLRDLSFVDLETMVGNLQWQSSWESDDGGITWHEMS
jgi:hypothetical protein